ncbi:hypothetical protein QBC33DRAFT_192097 [Phialemonium atrogriseum]|uniref:Uncharacterized protein n=1 Tax=Phialemonium atrogriseum TaxID=1093897 RepID=A0AAJ0BUP6_9PEZI|nr:uncharacterized protein QBC33DRAFT_192097 [Phialemonium atrogriseum]KAK1764650.1 hypothetical protein QBC33DRAFT_192097 [Phialemonium atrogriseum]
MYGYGCTIGLVGRQLAFIGNSSFRPRPSGKRSQYISCLHETCQTKSRLSLTAPDLSSSPLPDLSPVPIFHLCRRLFSNTSCLFSRQHATNPPPLLLARPAEFLTPLSPPPSNYPHYASLETTDTASDKGRDTARKDSETISRNRRPEKELAAAELAVVLARLWICEFVWLFRDSLVTSTPRSTFPPLPLQHTFSTSTAQALGLGPQAQTQASGSG